MDDNAILTLYFSRDETAIDETAKKYGGYCYFIANNILEDPLDASESVNDTYLGAWNSIPPQRPAILRAYLGKITRNIALKRRRDRLADKRGGGEAALALEELTGCVAVGSSVEREVQEKTVADAISRFLWELPETTRQVFVRRYWYLESVSEISERFGFSVSKVKSILLRTRERLRAFLLKEGLYDEQ